MEPLVSIIIPLFNEKTTITTPIKSILNQNYSNIEILIIDEASTDSSMKIINKLALKDKRIKSIETNGEGIQHSRNIGLQKAQRRLHTFF